MDVRPASQFLHLWSRFLKTARELAHERLFPREGSERRALRNAAAATTGLAAAIVIGSRGLRDFDGALAHYAAICLVALFATVHRLTFWLERPPTRVLFARAAKNLLSGKLRRGAGSVGAAAGPAIAIAPPLLSKFAFQDFIRRRGWNRWLAHLCLSWGSTLAFALTFPLVFGWIHFEASAARVEAYDVRVFGVFAGAFSIHSPLAFLAFNALNFSAVLVLIGVGLAAARRLRDPGDRATQTIADDWLPLFILFAVSATGLLLTADTHWLAGRGYRVFAVVHAATVGVLLLYIPFGKLLHIFQRIASIAVSINKKAEQTAPRAHCAVCHEAFASAAQIEDLKTIEAAIGMGIAYATPRGAIHYQDVCPRCRRRGLAVNQGRAIGR